MKRSSPPGDSARGDGSGGTHKLWGGRFKAGPAAALTAVNRSIQVDFRLWPFDVWASQEWAGALASAGVLTADESSTIRDGLEQLVKRFDSGELPVESDEDVHTMIDRLLHEEIGDLASKLHTGRSRNDQVSTATRLLVRVATESIETEVRALQAAMLQHAGSLVDAVMPAYTHLQRAQPVSAAHWMLSHFWPLERDCNRITFAMEAASSLPLGSGAIAGYIYRITRDELRKQLGFLRLSENSI
ncbi:MAG: lyase family protein, partial [Gemmatimonadaceae bacterium]